VVAVYEDEASFYRQPSQGSLLAQIGRRQPHMRYSAKSNTLVRIAGALNAVAGALHYRRASKITVPQLITFYQQLLDEYPQALMIYVIEDNWPVHFHDKVRAFLVRNPRMQVLRLPTYAPWLNPIEKAWKWVRQTLCHAHEFCDQFDEYKAALDEQMAEAIANPAMMLRYCGMAEAS
jgi:transposase